MSAQRDGTLRIAHWHAGVTTLGPGPAVGLWVQGCGLGCRGCMSPHTWDPAGGHPVGIDDLAAQLNDSGLACLTISGGEPFDQAPALAALITTLRIDRDWLVTSYSGYGLADLRAGSRPGSRELLATLDLLIDGPYRRDRHAPLLWRASSNQQIHNLSGRVTLPADRPAGVELHVDPDGNLGLVGVLTGPGHLEAFDAAIAPFTTSTAAPSAVVRPSEVGVRIETPRVNRPAGEV